MQYALKSWAPKDPLLANIALFLADKAQVGFELQTHPHKHPKIPTKTSKATHTNIQTYPPSHSNPSIHPLIQTYPPTHWQTDRSFHPWEEYVREGQGLLQGQQVTFQRPRPETDRLFMAIEGTQALCSFSGDFGCGDEDVLSWLWWVIFGGDDDEDLSWLCCLINLLSNESPTPKNPPKIPPISLKKLKTHHLTHQTNPKNVSPFPPLIPLLPLPPPPPPPNPPLYTPWQATAPSRWDTQQCLTPSRPPTSPTPPQSAVAVWRLESRLSRTTNCASSSRRVMAVWRSTVSSIRCLSPSSETARTASCSCEVSGGWCLGNLWLGGLWLGGLWLGGLWLGGWWLVAGWLVAGWLVACGWVACGWVAGGWVACGWVAGGWVACSCVAGGWVAGCLGGVRWFGIFSVVGLVCIVGWVSEWVGAWVWGLRLGVLRGFMPS